ncbi:hypothetical protein NQ318_013014 [Aromia moschata]|uniref:Uncharacterized protein n=1 Tax=Aromia moschata TaxID=1265417 RepID=A0AAV8XVT5_9CUCU|nr:hypothetical protein NQ318_013014 [Aromia moschata]
MHYGHRIILEVRDSSFDLSGSGYTRADICVRSEIDSYDVHVNRIVTLVFILFAIVCLSITGKMNCNLPSEAGLEERTLHKNEDDEDAMNTFNENTEGKFFLKAPHLFE